MNQANTWLSTFLSKENRNLDAPDAKPLFAYQMSEDEFTDLRSVLKNCLVDSYGSVDWLAATERLFVIYAAEWWRRKYEGGPWRWEDVLQSISWPNLSISKRQELAKVGLKFWKRDVSQHKSGNTAYLMSLVTEGGFPVRLVERSETHLSRFLNAVLADYTKYVSAGMSAVKIAESHNLWLPAIFRKPAIYQLAADLIELMYEFSSFIGDSADPFQTLEDSKPDWRTRLPISLESKGARSLVNGLLKSAKSRREKRSDRLSLRREFIINEEGLWQHRAQVELPSSMLVNQLAEETKIKAELLPRRLELAICYDGKINKVATLSKEGDQYYVYARGLDRLRLALLASTGATCLIVENGGGRIGELPLLGGEGLDEDLPLVAYKDNESLIVLGQGGVRSRFENLYVSLPLNASIVEGEDQLEALDMSSEDFHDGVNWMRVSGKLKIKIQGGFTCSITAGDITDSDLGCILRGKRSYLYEPQNMPCYLGMPNILQVKDSQTKQVDHCNVFWAPAGRVAQWISVSERMPLGAIKLRVIVNGDCIYSGRCTVLPKSFAVDLSPGLDAVSGKIVLSGVCGASAVTKFFPMVDTVIDNEEEQVVIACHATQPFAGKLSIELVWQGLESCTVMLPFPGRGAHFVDVDGQEISGRMISMDDLVKMSVVAVSPDSHRKYSLQGQLRASDVSTSLSRSGMTLSKDIDSISEGYYELSLVEIYSAIRDLFSYSADLDAVVLLEVISFSTVVARIKVTQFDSRLSYDQNTQQISHLSNSFEPITGHSEIQFVSLGGRDIPKICGTVLTEAGGTAWQLSEESLDACPSLALACGVETRSIRPCVVFSVGNDGNIDDDGSLISIFSTLKPTERDEKFKQFMATLVADPSHEGWSEIIDAVRRFSEVHPNSLDLYKAIIEFPTVAAGILIRLTEADIEILLDWQDYLPFGWWQIPIDSYIDALKGYSDYVNTEYPEYSELMLKTAYKQLTQLAEFIPALEVSVDIVLESVLSKDSLGLYGRVKVFGGTNIYRHLNTKVKKDLFVLHAQDTWPQGLCRDDWDQEFRSQIPWLSDERMGYRKPFLDAVVAQSFSVVKNHYLVGEHGSFVCAMRAFNSKKFDEMLKFAISAFYLSN